MRWLLVGILQIVALVATFFWKPLGTEGWHHVASLVLVLAACIPLRRRLQERPFLGIGVLVTSILAVVSGFYLLYWKEGIRVDGYQDWGVWWHVAWSWAAAVFFWQHTWINRQALGHFFRRSLRPAPAVLHGALYVAAIAGLVATIVGKGRFDATNYIQWSLWTWLVATGLALLVALLVPRAKARGARGAVDLGLVPVAAVATLSGIPLLWLGEWLDGAGLKYASKYWHVAPSVLFSVLVFIHTVQLWSGVKAHVRRLAI